jgi:hypothetical protein
MRIITSSRLLLISLWLGAALFFSAVVAPIVFQVLRGFGLVNANEIAGTIVTRSLAIINTGGFAISVLVLVTVFFFRQAAGRMPFLAEVTSLGIVVIMTALGEWVISARMRALRLAMVTIDQVSPGDPRRVAFDNLHRYSVASLGIAMLAATIALVLIARRTQR